MVKKCEEIIKLQYQMIRHINLPSLMELFHRILLEHGPYKKPGLEAFCFLLLLTTWTCVYKLVCFAHFVDHVIK